jgi:hypothetical protein
MRLLIDRRPSTAPLSLVAGTRPAGAGRAFVRGLRRWGWTGLCPLLLAAAFARADTVILKNGDHISGDVRVRKTSVRVKTPYGRLNVRSDDVERIVRDDGTVVGPDGEPLPPPPPAVAKLELVVTGQAFWQAWRKGAAPADPSLRLELRLGGEPVAVWWDRRLDENEIKGAVVNVFDFTPGNVVSSTVDGVETRTVESKAGRVDLEVTVPARLLDRRVVSVVYQVNGGSVEDPKWRDVTGGSSGIVLDPKHPLRLLVSQDGGRMEYGGLLRKQMRRSETFGVSVQPVANTPS